MPFIVLSSLHPTKERKDGVPRNPICRKVCRLPDTARFDPVGKTGDGCVMLAVGEYEAIRLIDREGFSQQECSEYMKVARTTVQLIYASARRKIATALTDGLTLKIEGGSYRLCDGSEAHCGCGGCKKHQKKPSAKEPGSMKIAVTYENGDVFQHFGHTEQFKVYDIENNAVAGSQVLSTNGSGHGALAGFLKAHGVDTLICGGIGGGAQTALAQAGIALYGGVQGSADEAVQALLAGQIAYDPNVKCDHHEHHGGHDCGSHGCGK